MIKNKREIIFATGNMAKVDQMRFIADLHGFNIDTINGKKAYGDAIEYDENAPTTQEIARQGAIFVAKKIGKSVIAEDTDLSVDILNGFPSIRAGLFLKNFGRDGLLNIMKHQTNRRATITSSCCYATPQGDYKNFTHSIHGVIAKKEAFGDYPTWISPAHSPKFGGGYNAIFIPDGPRNKNEKTLAQIAPENAMLFGYREKNFFDILSYITGL